MESLPSSVTSRSGLDITSEVLVDRLYCSRQCVVYSLEASDVLAPFSSIGRRGSRPCGSRRDGGEDARCLCCAERFGEDRL